MCGTPTVLVFAACLLILDVHSACSANFSLFHAAFLPFVTAKLFLDCEEMKSDCKKRKHPSGSYVFTIIQIDYDAMYL